MECTGHVDSECTGHIDLESYQICYQTSRDHNITFSKDVHELIVGNSSKTLAADVFLWPVCVPKGKNNGAQTVMGKVHKHA